VSLPVQLGFASFLGHRFHDPENDQAEPEVHDQAQVDVGTYMPRANRQIGQKQNVGRVSPDHRDQGVNEIGHS
jgi:hypothetical protein